MNQEPPKIPHLVALQTHLDDEEPDDVDIQRLWGEVGKLALDGKIPLQAAQRMCRMMIVASSSRRNHHVKTHVARELRVSRRVARGLLKEWTERDEGRELLGEPDDYTTR